jgi:creatinine amidohydrolase/Fe(II)-dependent formamide hydrolase-like protein
VKLIASKKESTVFFEENAIGRMKKEVFEASEQELEKILSEYDLPPKESELTKEGSYIQNTPRWKVEENRKKNDIVLIPVGCSENHGRHMCSWADTYFVTYICEAVRRYTQKQGRPVNIAMPPLPYGGHPYHHLGMPGTIPLSQATVMAVLQDVMLGLWNDGFRKQILINNHGQLWMLEGAIQEFCKTYQLPGIYRVIDWHRAVREAWLTKDRGGDWDTNFVHADEAETSLGLYLFPEKVDMKYAVDTKAETFLPDGHFGTSVDPVARPSRWSEGEGHVGIEIRSTPEGVIGSPTKATAAKAKRPLAMMLRYLTLLCDQIFEAFPPGQVPPVEKVTNRSAKEMEPYLREPLSKGWKSVYELPLFVR